MALFWNNLHNISLRFFYIVFLLFSINLSHCTWLVSASCKSSCLVIIITILWKKQSDKHNDSRQVHNIQVDTVEADDDCLTTLF